VRKEMAGERIPIVIFKLPQMGVRGLLIAVTETIKEKEYE
jgi:hypothetical protein